MNLPSRVKHDPTIHIAVMDNNSNCLLYFQDGKVGLWLETEQRDRNLGIIKEKTLFIKRDSERHLHRKSNSYGFNYNLLKMSKSFNKIVLTEDNENMYVMPKDIILNMGKVMYFKNSEDGNSFEVQIFLNRDIIKTYKK